MTATYCAAPAEIGLLMQHTTQRWDKHKKTQCKAARTQEPRKKRGGRPSGGPAGPRCLTVADLHGSVDQAL